MNNKEGKAFNNSYKNLVFIDFIVPESGRHGVRFAKEFREALDTGLGPVMLRNFALGREVPRRGTFTYITGVTP